LTKGDTFKVLGDLEGKISVAALRRSEKHIRSMGYKK